MASLISTPLDRGNPPLMSDPLFLDVGEGAGHRRIAWRRQPGRMAEARSEVVWLGGFRSDMLATKATHLAEWSARTGRTVTRFDYSGHGESGGRFEDGTIGRWLEEALAVIAAATPRPPILGRSSLGRRHPPPAA